VLVLPGLFANDLYLMPLHGWLARIGYRPVISRLAINAGCPDRLRDEVEAELRQQMQRHPGPVCIIGHSRGGMLGWALATRLQGGVSHLILVGSPAAALSQALRTAGIRGKLDTSSIPANQSVADASNRARRLLDPDCNFPECGCAYLADVRRLPSPSTQVVSIYSKDDPIVPPQACPVPGARNVEVRGSHSGLVYNTAVYRELATALADR
jgi:pimeloyl-ACP methyl ester carboxylesterase